jgi:hypothetical protein
MKRKFMTFNYWLAMNLIAHYNTGASGAFPGIGATPSL